MDNKKVFDILPPQEKIVLPQKKNQEKPILAPPKTAGQKTAGFRMPKILLFFIFLLLVFILSSEFVFNRAEVNIWPQMELKVLSENITISQNQKIVDSQSLAIPGQILEQEQSVIKEFSATGKTMDGQKASGKIRVYNNYSDSIQVLVKNTRFISAEGKLFRTTEKIIIPGATYSGGKLQASYIDVNVVADQAGQDYNISPSTFSIPGFAGTAKYTAFYGKSFEAMSGGILGEVSQIQKEDLDNAKKELTDQAMEEAKTLLKNKISDDSILMNQAVSQEILSASSSLSAGDKSEKFIYQVKIKLRAIIFSADNLENLAKELIANDLDLNKKIKEESLGIDYDFYSLDSVSGKMILSANFSSKIYSPIDENTFTKNLAGQSLEDAKQIIANQPEIDKVRIKSWPFWQNSLPQEETKVKIRIILD